jgi:hypothetical protein
MLVAHNQHGWKSRPDVSERLAPIGVGAIDPEPLVLELGQAAGQIGYPHHLEVMNGPGRGLDDTGSY